MRKILKAVVTVVTLALSMTMPAHTPPAQAAEWAADWAIALPNALPGGKSAIEAPLWRTFTETLQPGDRYRVVTDRRQIARIDLPEDKAFKRAKRRARHFKAENAQIYAHLQAMGSGPATLDIPGLLRREALNRLDPARPLALLVIGDVVQAFAEEPAFSLRDEDGGFRIPSDAHIRASLGETPWGLGAEGHDGLAQVAVHLCHTGGAPALKSDEEDSLRRFWALYIAHRGGVLASWSADLATCFARFAARIDTPVIEATPNPRDRLLVMRTLGRDAVGIETVEGGKTVINGVEVEDFNLFARKRHPTLGGVDVVTGIRYKPADYPDKYEASWCYFSILKRGIEVKFDLGSKSPGSAPTRPISAASAREAAGITKDDFEAGKQACQWPTP